MHWHNKRKNWQVLTHLGHKPPNTEMPEWFRNAKFGIWAHWGPQCQPEAGDWYGRGMYEEGGAAYKWHLEHYGHPSEFGFKDVINEWKAEKWNPERLVALFKKTGARYFFAMGNHHDNMDLWDSKYQSWNSVNMGPKRNVLGEWEKAARKNKLPSVSASTPPMLGHGMKLHKEPTRKAHTQESPTMPA